jgi:hypothetical protein
MPTITKTFTYTGTVQEVAIPAGTNSMDIYLWGGAGGGGGGDAGGPGGVGAAGHYVTASAIDLTSYVGQTLKVGVGGGGAGGSSGGGAPGGVNGKSITGYSGGRGGNAGPNPYSGGGGAGGGATVILIDSTEIAIAGGGGGGAGAGQYSNGTAGINSNSATAGSPLTLGENGADHSGDGGGGGGAGGGDAGGRGGSGGSGDNGGTGGYAGSNLVPAGGSANNGSGQAPGGTGDANYQSGVAVGANPAGTGGNGLAVLVFTIGVQAKYKVSGAWKDTSNLYYKVSGAWKEITAAYVKVAGTWKAMFNSGIEFLSTAAGFGDAIGNSSSGTPGSGGGGGCFVAGTPITMADGTTKPVELVDLRDEVAVGGYVFATGKFIIDNLYDYKGIKVSGLHMVKEDGRWMRVMDSEHGVSLGDDEHVVYVFGSEYRRIVINGIEFTDYFEISEKEELLNHGDKFFGIWQDHDRQIHEKNVKILNDGK